MIADERSERPNRRTRIAIIGAGISGLSAAYYLEKMTSPETDLSAHPGGCEPPHITVIEQSDRIGGKIDTHRRSELLIERGPDSFLARKEAMLELAADLQLLDQLVATNPQASRVYLAASKELLPFPRGLKLAIPTDTRAIVDSRLLSTKDKIRVLADQWLPPNVPDDEDCSVGELLRKRFGRGYVEKICEPILAGIYAADLYGLSVKATFPQFLQMAVESGSLIRSVRRQWTADGSDSASAGVAVSLPDTLRSSTFLSFRGGFGQLLDRLQLALQRTTIHKNTSLEALERIDSHRANKKFAYRLHLSSGENLEVDAVIMTTSTDRYARWFESLTASHALKFPEMVSVANVIYAFRKSDVVDALDGSGFLVPRTLGKLVTACTWTSSKWPHVANSQSVLLRAYVGRSGQKAWQRYDDRELQRHVLHELREWVRIPDTPVYSEVNRWYDSMPQYAVGHLAEMERVRRIIQSEYPNVYLTGAAFRGVGLPDVISQAKDAARELVADWS